VNQTGKSLFACLALFAFSFSCVQAGDFDSSFGNTETYPALNQSGFHAVERLGITLGGNVISRIARADGTIREITAGGLYQVGLGVLYRYEVIPLSIAMTFNYHVNSDHNDSNNASFRRNPLEALAYFNGPGDFRFGGGIRYVYAARASSSLNGMTERISFANARGSIVEIGYQVRPYGWVSLRYVKEKYTIETYSTTGSAPGLIGNTPYDGTHVGFFIGYEY
jgi:hypothetical protein